MADFAAVLNLAFASCYFGIAYVLGTRFTLPTHQTVARVALVSFFMGCGLHHVAFATHSFSVEQIDFASWHHVIPAIMQMSAPVFLWAMWPHIPTMLAPATYDANQDMPGIVVESGSRSGAILEANPLICELLGWEADELIGKPLDTLIPDRNRPAHHHFRKGYDQDPQPRPMGPDRQINILCKDGTEKVVWIGLAPIAKGKVAAAVLYVGGVPAKTLNP